MKKIFKRIMEFFGLTKEQQLQAQKNMRASEAKSKVNIRYGEFASWLVIDGFDILRITNETNIRNGSIALDEVPLLIETVRDRYINGKE